MRILRGSAQDSAGGGTGFFVPRSTLIKDAFFLAYGGLHWSFSEVRSFNLRTREQFVEALEQQLEYEREEIEKKR